MQRMKNLALFFYRVYAFAILILFILLLFPFVLLFSILPQPLGGNLIYRFSAFFTSLAFFLLGIKHEVRFDAPLNKDHAYVFVFNHISYLDALILVKSLQSQSFRGLGKHELVGIPIFGFIYRQAVITVKRKSKEDRAKSLETMKQYLAQGVSIALAPEGTFNTTGQPLIPFYDGAFKIAIQTETPLVPILFLGTNEVLHHSSIFSLRPGKTTTIFLQTTDVKDYDMDQLESLKQKIHAEMSEKLLHTGASWILKTNKHA